MAIQAKWPDSLYLRVNPHIQIIILAAATQRLQAAIHTGSNRYYIRRNSTGEKQYV